MDLPTYTNIWRIEKRLYKLYDFRLPAPLPITWIGVFVGITVPYVVFLIAVGLPFNHNLVWLYILPPGVLTWLWTRPVIESKRLPELVNSQVRYVAEPRTWCRMAPFAEKDEILVTARVWHPSAQGPAEEGEEGTGQGPVDRARAAARRGGGGGTGAGRRASGQGQAAGREAAGRAADGPAAARGRRPCHAPPPVVAGRRAWCSADASRSRCRCRNARRPAGLPSEPRRRSRRRSRRGRRGRTDRNPTSPEARPPPRHPIRICPLRGPPRRLRPRYRRPGRLRSRTIPIPVSAARTRRRLPSARHPGRCPRPTCSRWSARAPSRPRSRSGPFPEAARSPMRARSRRLARSPRLAAEVGPEPAADAEPRPGQYGSAGRRRSCRSVPAPGSPRRAGTCPA